MFMCRAWSDERHMHLKEMGKTLVRIAGRAKLESATGGSATRAFTVRAIARSPYSTG